MGLPNEEWRVCFANDGNAPDSSGRGKPRERNATDAFAAQFAVCVRVRASCVLCACARAVCAHACLSVRACVCMCVQCARRCVPRGCSACSIRLVRHVPESAVCAERRHRRQHVWRREVSVEGARASAHVPFLRHTRTRAHKRTNSCVRASIPACAHAWVTHACAQPIGHMHGCSDAPISCRYKHWRNPATISRASQPLPGMLGRSNEDDQVLSHRRHGYPAAG